MEKKTIVAAGGLVKNDYNEILLIFRRGVWDLPKGKLDKGETVEHCALREVEEETGLQNLELGNLIHTTHHEYFDKFLKQEVIKETHWYAMRLHGNQTLVPQKEEDIDEIVWRAPDALENYMNNMHKNIIEVIQKYLALTDV